MADTVRVELEIAADTPTSMTFADTYAGLERVWYRFSADADGNVELWATPDGFEHLARRFLKLARTNKVSGYHSHGPLESGRGPTGGVGPELTIGVTDAPGDVA
jgi:hypothetical protein